MRAQGVTACISGLSANPIEDGFLNAGANAFIQKPFPCEQKALQKEVCRVIMTHPVLAQRFKLQGSSSSRSGDDELSS